MRGTGVLFFLLGIFVNIIDVFKIFLSKEETPVITIFGLAFVVLGVLIWNQKTRFTMQAYLAGLERNKFRLKTLIEEGINIESPKFD